MAAVKDLAVLAQCHKTVAGASFTVACGTEAGQDLGQVSPSVYLDKSTLQQRLDAQVLTMPDHDLFVVYRGVNVNGDYSLDVRVNPLILCVWAGFLMLVLGTAIAACGKRPSRGSRGESGEPVEPAADAADEVAAA
mgnify:CR=1 FL=1